MKTVLLMWLLVAPKYSADSWLSVLVPHCKIGQTFLQSEPLGDFYGPPEIIPKCYYVAPSRWDGTAQ